MKKALLAVVALVGVGGFIAILTYKPTAPTVGRTTDSSNAPTATSNSNGNPSASTVAGASTASFKDGSYTGSVADTVYGPVQVSITVSGGKLSAVKWLQTPNDRDRSQEISDQADPILVSEAVTAQSAKVDAVSGATQTSEGFNKSLDSALKQAQS